MYNIATCKQTVVHYCKEMQAKCSCAQNKIIAAA